MLEPQICWSEEPPELLQVHVGGVTVVTKRSLHHAECFCFYFYLGFTLLSSDQIYYHKMIKIKIF